METIVRFPISTKASSASGQRSKHYLPEVIAKKLLLNEIDQSADKCISIFKALRFPHNVAT